MDPDPDPDPLVRGTDPQQNSRIPNTARNSVGGERGMRSGPFLIVNRHYVRPNVGGAGVSAGGAVSYETEEGFRQGNEYIHCFHLVPSCSSTLALLFTLENDKFSLPIKLQNFARREFFCTCSLQYCKHGTLSGK